ncbi:hypothetical protein DAPPUDRAFT_314608 [Daphnia pulex]|uniref:TIR domain-containing protein n=1 Tax=Daphnia pulex TaxID=6669 RepID=E9G6W0_DAPPU|nr:hypothetical protein DAPPUDRAFT_314608 [Daphnia pulex]|eukprot:EFX84748.1 hypothetical protein DAPPUDRAFT_314608 [Daphnia pulex]
MVVRSVAELWLATAAYALCSLVPMPSAVRNYTLNTIDVRMLYESGDCACFCKLTREWTVCVGKDCLNVPRTINIFNRRLKVTGTEIATIGPLDFARYSDLLELQLDGNLLTNIENGTFANLSQLVNLSISSNRLASISPDAFRGLVSLRSLRLMKNRFLALSDVVPSLVPLTALRFLSLSDNTLSRVDAADFIPLRHSQLEALDLSNCDLKYIGSEAFMPFKKLQRLILSENTMPEDNLIYLIHTMQETGLKALDLSQLRFAGSPPRTLLEALSRTDVEELNLSKNTLPRLSPKIFPLMPRIRDLDLSACGIISIENGTFSLMPLLMRLNLAQNGLEDIPPAVMILPQLQWLSLSGNSGSAYEYGGGELKLEDGNFALMSNLTYLDLSFNRVGQVTREIFDGLSRLEELNLKNNSLYRLSEGCFHPLVSLKILHLDGNAFGKQNFSRSTFYGLNSLEYLNMDRCKLSFTDQEAIFAGAPRLRHLSMRDNQIVSFGSRNPFADATSLVSVDLFKNRIRGWDTQLFAGSPDLDVLNLAENQISTVSKAMMADIANLSEVDLLGNPIDCDCNLEPLRRYALYHEDTEDSNLLIKADHCSSPDKWRFQPITSFLLELDPDHCYYNIQASIDDQDPDVDADYSSFISRPHVIALYILIPTVCLSMLVGYAIYRSRWVIRYYMFRKRLSQTNLMSSSSMAELEGNFKYDAFVSYSNVDHAFVARMVGMLENAPPHYKLCVYERDFTAGNVLNDCIMQSIATSRKVVLVISENFIQSHWCLWELHLAQHSLLEDKRNGLVLVVVGKLKLNQCPPTLRFLMKTRIYLEWDLDPSKQRVFWERLRDALAPSSLQKSISLPDAG